MDANELRARLGPSQVDGFLKAAGKGDGKVDYAEFCRLLNAK